MCQIKCFLYELDENKKLIKSKRAWFHRSFITTEIQDEFFLFWFKCDLNSSSFLKKQKKKNRNVLLFCVLLFWLH